MVKCSKGLFFCTNFTFFPSNSFLWSEILIYSDDVFISHILKLIYFVFLFERYFLGLHRFVFSGSAVTIFSPAHPPCRNSLASASLSPSLPLWLLERFSQYPCFFRNLIMLFFDVLNVSFLRVHSYSWSCQFPTF